MRDKEETKRQKARELRYRKPVVKNINLDTIQDQLSDMIEACDSVRYYFDKDDDTLLNVLEGDEDQTSEFRMMFADLSAEVEQMWEDLRWEYIPKCFDEFFVAIGAGDCGGGYLGWDSFEQDYFGISCEDSYVENESRRKLMRMTKEQLILSAKMCFKIYHAYFGPRHRFDCLKAAMDILRDENTGYLQMVKRIEETYEKADRDRFNQCSQSTRDLEHLLSCMPGEAWIQ